jgi:hypothetical protein
MFNEDLVSTKVFRYLLNKFKIFRTSLLPCKSSDTRGSHPLQHGVNLRLYHSILFEAYCLITALWAGKWSPLCLGVKSSSQLINWFTSILNNVHSVSKFHLVGESAQNVLLTFFLWVDKVIFLWNLLVLTYVFFPAILICSGMSCSWGVISRMILNYPKIMVTFQSTYEITLSFWIFRKPNVEDNNSWISRMATETCIVFFTKFRKEGRRSRKHNSSAILNNQLFDNAMMVTWV